MFFYYRKDCSGEPEKPGLGDDDGEGCNNVYVCMYVCFAWRVKEAVSLRSAEQRTKNIVTHTHTHKEHALTLRKLGADDMRARTAFCAFFHRRVG